MWRERCYEHGISRSALSNHFCIGLEACEILLRKQVRDIGEKVNGYDERLGNDG